MANKKFSDLDTASTLTGVELFAVSQSGVSKKSLLSAVKSFLDSAVATLTNKTFDTAGVGNLFKINGTTISANTGTGSNVLATSPTLVTPALGTPSSGVATNLTGTAAGLTAGSVTTNANLTGPITSIGNATSVAAQTGTGSTFVMQASPTLTTPTIGVASATSINKVAITAPTTSATLTLADGSTHVLAGAYSSTFTITGTTALTFPTTGTLATLAGSEALTNKTYNGNTFTAGTGTLTIAAGKTLTSSNTLTVAGTDGTTMTFPTTSATLARTDAANTFTGAQSFSGQILEADGTPAAPSYAFSGETNTGFYKSAVGQIALSITGTQHLVYSVNGPSINASSATSGYRMGATAAGPDLILARDAADIFAQRRGSNAQTYRLYNTYTDASNYERLGFTWASNSATIAVEAAGTGTLRTFNLGATGKGNVGQMFVDYTNTATVGAVTINKAAGRVNIAASGTSVVVTNNLVTAASHVMVVMSTVDSTGMVTSVVPAAGSFTINTVAVTAQASFDFFVINAD